MIKAIIFDLDGTLFDISQYILVFSQFQKKASIELGGNKEIDYSIPETYEPLRLPDKESREYLRTKWNVDPDSFWEKVEEYDLYERGKAITEGSVKPFDDVDIIKELKKHYKIGLLSNTACSVVKLELESFDMVDLFDDITCFRYKTADSKPEPPGASEQLRRLGVTGSEAVMVGDSDVDVLVGKVLNMKTVQIFRGHYGYGGNPDHSIKTLYELNEILNSK